MPLTRVHPRAELSEVTQPSAVLSLEQEFCLCPAESVELQTQLITWRLKVLICEALPVSLGLSVR